MDFKLVDSVLWSSIKNQVDADFGKGITQELVGDLIPVTLENESEMPIYLSPTNWIDIIEQGLGSYELRSLGIVFGKIVRGEFRFSISVLSWIASLTDSLVIISGRGAESFTYGKSILKESVLKVMPDLKKGQRVIVLNENHDCLGLASMASDGYRVDSLRPDDLVAKNLADIGLYLRKFF